VDRVGSVSTPPTQENKRAKPSLKTADLVYLVKTAIHLGNILHQLVREGERARGVEETEWEWFAQACRRKHAGEVPYFSSALSSCPF